VSEVVKVNVTRQGERRYASTGSPWESRVGYSRAVRVGSQIAVTGTVGQEPDGSFKPSLEAQARRAITIIEASLKALGGSLRDVVRTRIYVTDIARWEEAGRVHGEFFGTVLPATTMVEVVRLIDPAALVEIEADAIILEEA
jgi:enamine deaminase RidA (YjgF/YER057c/UK114 family)